MSHIYYEETQKFGRNGLWFAILSLFIIVLYSFLQLISIGLNWIIMTALLPSVLLLFFFVLFFRRFELQVRVSKQALEFQFLPIQDQIQVVEWEYVEQVEIVQASPARKFAGWGISYGNVRAYGLGTSEGVEITFPNKRKLYLGSKNARELYTSIRKQRNEAKRKQG